MFVLTADNMRKAEAACVAREGIDYLTLMKRAGQACAAQILNMNQWKHALILCGKGKNGGDGFVIGARLAEAGRKVTVLLVNGEPKAEDAVTCFNELDTDAVRIIRYNGNPAETLTAAGDFDLVVDCIFGTGFKGLLDEKTAMLTATLKALRVEAVAVDAPSGVDCDSASADPNTLRAALTLAIAAVKPAHIQRPASELCGKVMIADIGINDGDIAVSEPQTVIYAGKEEANLVLPRRPAGANKGTFGHALAVCGSMRMQGAAVLAAKGAMRMGAGLVTVAFPEKAYPAVAAKLTESLLLPLPCDDKGFFTEDAFEETAPALAKATALLIGCGMGLTDGTQALFRRITEATAVPTVIDADGINALALNIDSLKAVKAPVVLTPHPGEMSRLTGLGIRDILNNTADVAYEYANKWNATVVLKTAETVVCTPNRPLYRNTTGNNILSKGGSGDLLAGMTVSLLAQGLPPFEAATAACYLHGLAADRSIQMFAPAVLPGDLADNLPTLLSDYQGC